MTSKRQALVFTLDDIIRFMRRGVTSRKFFSYFIFVTKLVVIKVLVIVKFGFTLFLVKFYW